MRDVIMENSGIFGYINYLVEKDRRFIIDTLLNGALPDRHCPGGPVSDSMS
jgi:hypothetical protein